MAEYTPIQRSAGYPQIHCEALTGRLRMSGECWGQVAWYETRDPLRGIGAAPRCPGHAGLVYRATCDLAHDTPVIP